MKKSLSLLLLFSVTLSLYGVAQERLWNDLSPTDPGSAQRRLSASPWPGKHRLVKLNTAIAKQLQQLAPMENAQAPFPVAAVPFGIPLPEGGLHPDIITESPVLSPDMQVLYPSIKTYRLRDERSKRFTGRITITSQGVSGLVFTDSGAAYISPAPGYGAGAHVVYYVKDIELPVALRCTAGEELNRVQTNDVPGSGNPLAGDCQLRTYRVAVSATGEFTQWAGSVSNAVSAITSTINEVSAIYERDATIRFVLVNNTNVIYTDPASDPFPSVDFPDINILNTNHNTLVSTVGNGNFDLGMVFNNGWNGGLARLSSTCTGAGKGSNAAGLSFGTGANPTPGPQGPVFTGTVAHEIAHQFSATHSFAANNGQCGSNANEPTAWEPGGGSTIMAYAGSCSGNSYQNNSDLYFHAGSIRQITGFAVGSGTCAVITGTSNTPPVVSVTAASYTIPPGTPFELRAMASDANANLLYSWEQMDAGPLTGSKPSASAGSGPLFRSFPPNGDPARVFPAMSAILSNTMPDYEVLPTVARSMTFRVTVRDGAPGGGCTGEANITVTTAGATPFQVTSQNTSSTWTANGSNTATIAWNPGSSNTAPVNCASVNILFSVDGGFSYPYTLASGVPNNGSAQIIVPNLSTNSGRIRVQAVDNIFFDVNNANISITTSCSASGAMISPADAVTANAGDPSLDLSLSAAYGAVINNFPGQLTSSDPKSGLVFNSVATGNCQASGNVYQYKRHRFMVNRAGNYTFTIPAATYPAVMNLYQVSYDPANPCNNFLNSNGTRMTSNVNISTSFTQSLSPGIYYELTVGTFSYNSPALPLNYTISSANNAGGSLYSNYPSPGAGFNYTYVIVNNTTGQIKAFDASADLSNANTYPPGSYAVYGLSHASSITAATLNGYVGSSFDAFKQAILNNPGTLCSNLSANAVQVTIKGDGPPPLLPLSAILTNNSVLLKWSTSSEEGVSHFEIHRSNDGSNFQKLPGEVNAKGNSTTPTDYTYTDNAPASGANYYRIRQVNLDEQVVMSTIARAERIDVNFRLKLRPNPLKDRPLYVEYITDEREELRILITDSKGAVLVRSVVNVKVGLNQFQFNVQHFAKGLYFVTIHRDAGTIADRFIKE
jgi:hypothetical protein